MANTLDLPKSIPQSAFVGIKQWIYEVCEKVTSSHAEARSLAFQITLLLEYLALNLVSFSVPFDSRYFQLYAVLLLDKELQLNEELRSRYSSENLFKLTTNSYTNQEFYKLKGEIESLDLKNLVKQETPLKELERLFKILPQQTNQIKNISLILLDAYNLQFFSILANKNKIAAATISVARFWVYEKEEAKWNEEYSANCGLNLADFKEEYDQIYSIAYIINQKNLAKKREEEDEEKKKREIELSFIL